MGKYVLVGICLLAFVAGGVAQLALRRPSEKSGVEENVVKTSGGSTAPEVSEKAGGQAAQTGNGTEAPRGEAEAADVEAAVETTDIGNSGEESSDQTVVNAGEVRRVPPRRARRNANRAVGPRARAVRPAAPAGRQASTSYARSDDGLHRKTAKGVKKTGKWLGRGLKRVGGVFHD